MFAWASQYLLYAIGGLIVVGGASVGIQTYRLHEAKNEIVELTESLNKEKAVNSANKQTLDSIKKDGEELKASISVAQQAIILAERKHSQALQKMNQSLPIPTSNKCDDVANWARDVALRKELE